MVGSCAGLTFRAVATHTQYEPNRWRQDTWCCVTMLRCITAFQLSRECTLIILTFHVQQQPWSWLSHLSELQQMQDEAGMGWGWGGITPADPRRDQPKTNRKLLTLSWVRPNHLNPLTHSVTPPSPKAGWCDLSICSQNDKGRRAEIGQSALPLLFSLISLLHFVTLMDLLTPTLPPVIPLLLSCPQLAGVLIA